MATLYVVDVAAKLLVEINSQPSQSKTRREKALSSIDVE
ncbi:hypothetical protein VCG_002943 [Vibrio cholerae 12129(1)]|nr:hypothetical protein VCG_002943 [Vibrio cholerae 12129(1)]EEO04276.1 hypothetical protein VCA_003314 [Vibrio cholerae VL426]EEO07592.1 hypothetical protein VIF_001024 [Vibrio cholerae TM 11079-80]EEO12179.1 hypothetical protein VCB_003108 [Vibrio cholerae TMA 21]EEY52758.1 hypothetical protein VIH_000149 [Vibrio cholerae CT 5369-93]